MHGSDKQLLQASQHRMADLQTPTWSSAKVAEKMHLNGVATENDQVCMESVDLH